MKSGIEMMLESMGIQTDAIKQLLEPEKIKALLNKVEKMCDETSECNARLKRIETKLETMPDEEVMKLLADGKETAERETAEYVGDYNGNSTH